MSESQDPAADESADLPPIAQDSTDEPQYEQIRTEEPQAPFGQDEPNPDVVSDATADEKGPGGEVDPGIGGSGGRDPVEDTSRVPSVPETQDDADRHGAEQTEPGKD